MRVYLSEEGRRCTAVDLHAIFQPNNLPGVEHVVVLGQQQAAVRRAGRRINATS